jgi:hypothetical protein
MTGALVVHAFASAGVSTTLLEASMVGEGSTTASSALLLQWKVRRPSRGSLEYCLTERYCLYHQSCRGVSYRLDIHHPPWQLQLARATFARRGRAPAVGVIWVVAERRSPWFSQISSGFLDWDRKR